jgi:hypothetical protein
MGPTPLRFAAEMWRDPATVLPPLIMTDLSTNKPTELPPNQAAAELEIPDIELEYADLQAPPPAPPQVAGSVAGVPAVPVAAPAFMPPASGLMPPQMLLEYFGRSTNHQVFLSPQVEFVPPTPPVNRSSAVYISH